MSSTWRRYANGLVRDDLAAPDNGVNVNIRAALECVEVALLGAYNTLSSRSSWPTAGCSL